jgi:hypothetical protein
MSLELPTHADDEAGVVYWKSGPVFDFQIDFRPISDGLHSLLVPSGLC